MAVPVIRGSDQRRRTARTCATSTCTWARSTKTSCWIRRHYRTREYAGPPSPRGTSPTAAPISTPSLYLLFKSIREHSTVALSGEAADEVFGGYKWFHDPEVQRADTFPWVAAARIMGVDATAMLNADLLADLDLASYLRDSYTDAVAEVTPLDGASEHEHRMRVICYLHLARFVRALLDRKDRMSMAVGLEVRVPFCDHRLVEYVYNTPWSMKPSTAGRRASCARRPRTCCRSRSLSASRARIPRPRTRTTPSHCSSRPKNYWRNGITPCSTCSTEAG